SKSGKGGYTSLGWEEQRVAVLREIEDTPFFQAVRGGLVVGLYNQKEVWPNFGYEGESYSKGGYMARGFDDIEWL
ncbi:MAG: gluconate 2-dehydrogenase subunit 3 family protein, partial [Mesorhizobium sp.]